MTKKKIDFEKLTKRFTQIANWLAFLGLVISIVIKLNRLFGFWGKKKDSKEEKQDEKKVG